jgi:hypothetical protein
MVAAKSPFSRAGAGSLSPDLDGGFVRAQSAVVPHRDHMRVWQERPRVA